MAKMPAKSRRSVRDSRMGCFPCRKRLNSAVAPVPRRAAAASSSALRRLRKSSAKRWEWRCRIRLSPPPASIGNAMAVHAAFGGSTNLLLHIPAIAHAAGLPRPTVEDWTAINLRVPRIVDVLPNGPAHHPTVRVFLAGGVPEVMLQLRRLGALDVSVLTVSGITLGEVLDGWEKS